MLKRGWQARYLPPIVVENVSASVLVFWGYAWAALLFATAAANLFVALAFSLKCWVWFTATVPPASQLLLFVVQFIHVRFLVRRNIRAKMAQAPALSPAA